MRDVLAFASTSAGELCDVYMSVIHVFEAIGGACEQKRVGNRYAAGTWHYMIREPSKGQSSKSDVPIFERAWTTWFGLGGIYRLPIAVVLQDGMDGRGDNGTEFF
ncbi:hypothetical protein FS749_003249 [Ceratobasidium sp. UAMH 11750]|nr:hypothetical protein FS749_003249 [Ceratobasidium sp. UAMH 11750]